MRTVLFALIALAVPRAALACPVCFGQNDSPMAVATNMGIITLLIVVVGVLASFATFFIYLVRRAKLVEMTETADPGGFAASDPQEGTA
jgi:maltodextrin utilization protein YvdJ